MSDHTSGELIGGRFALGELLGVGGTGSVFAAVDYSFDEAAAVPPSSGSTETGAEPAPELGGAVDGTGSRRAAREAARVPGPSTSSGTGSAGTGAAGVPREVAVKLLHPHLCADEASRDAFLREAAHAMSLSHRNVVRVHAAGLHDAAGVIMPWIALDLLQGPTLREWVDSVGRLSPADAAAVADGMLDGLAAAHAAGIVHRDISPQNVILHGVQDRQRGEALTPEMVRIVDFGLADVTGRSTLGSDVLLARRPDASAGSATGVGGLATGVGGSATGSSDSANEGVVGNAAFMSPEQAQGRPVRAVSDLYQAGAVLYFALTGRAPFPRETTEQVLQAHVSAPPPVPSALNPAARPFDRVVTRAMAKTPAHRFRDAEEFRAAVRDVWTAGGASDASGKVDARGDIDLPGAVGVGDGPGADPATRMIPWASGEPLGYLSPALAEPATNAGSSRANGGMAAGVAGFIILALAGWAVVAAAAAPGAPLAADTTTSPPVPSVSASASSTPTPSFTPTVAASVPPVVPPTVTDAAVPALRGSLAEADAALRAAGLTLGTVTRVESADALDRVLAQNPAAGERVQLASTVNLTVASGSNVVPQVIGMSQASAIALMQSAGFVPTPDRAGASPDATVTATQPAAGTVLRVGVTLTLVIAVPSPTPPSPVPTTPAATPPAESRP
ncbi:serine/threonine protein kinase [Microbacterium sp. P07]|uniref:serine/threonine protein kinase n=1 Tax=Microbacterium sp. P07 TaxID=3366952 RepID=UPI00374698B5